MRGIPYSKDIWPITYDGIRATAQTHARKVILEQTEKPGCSQMR